MQINSNLSELSGVLTSKVSELSSSLNNGLRGKVGIASATTNAAITISWENITYNGYVTGALIFRIGNVVVAQIPHGHIG